MKHGSKQGTVEIELAKGPQQDANVVIKRQIRKEGNQSQFYLDNKPVPQRRVVEVAKSFNIQIDNLCQFLPQDRVVEFAGLTPVALLRETLRAAADDQMVEWLDDLIRLRGEEKHLEAERTSHEIQLKQLQAKQSASEEDVARYRAKEDLQKRQKLLEKCRPAIESRIVKEQFTAVRAQLQEARQELVQLEAEVAPAQKAQDDMESYRRSTEQVLQERRNLAERAKRQADEIDQRIKSQQAAVANFQSEIQGVLEADRTRKSDERRLEADINRINTLMNQRPVEINEEEYHEKRTQLHNQRLVASSEIRRLDDELKRLMDVSNERKHTRKVIMAKRASLETQAGKKMVHLEQVSRDTAQAWKWIEENKARLQLKGKVYPPPLLSCSIKDQRYADALEAQFGGIGDVTAITFTEQEDLRKVSNRIHGDIGLHQVTLRGVGKGMAAYKSPLTNSELRELGFESWLLDYLEGPEDVLAMLCESAKLHAAAYSPRPLTQEQHQRVESSNLTSWVAGPERFRSTRRYGQVSTRVTAVAKAKHFSDQPVDLEQKQRLDEEKDQIEAEVDDLAQKFDAATKQRRQHKNEAAAHADELVSAVTIGPLRY